MLCFVTQAFVITYLTLNHHLTMHVLNIAKHNLYHVMDQKLYHNPSEYLNTHGNVCDHHY